jgi:hypothetical protein
MKAVSWTLRLALCLVVIAPTSADALYRKAGIDLGGHIRTTNIVRHQDLDNLAFIMQRNTLKLRLEYKWLQRGKAFGKYNVPFLDRSDIFMLYRGVYDSVYDTTPGQLERKDFQGDPLSPRDVALESLDRDVRDELKFNNHIREAYIDLYFKQIPLTLRIGKQQVVWGESDGFRMLDRANTLDLSWHFFQELPPPGFGFDELRQPFFMVKGLYDLKQIGPLSQTFVEFYWNPGFDWNPGKIGFLPRPWGARILDPLENARGTGVFQSSFCRNAKDGTCQSLLNGTELFNQGNYGKNPKDNSQFGIRFHFLAGSTEWTINYLYQRFSPDGSPVAFVRGIPEEKMVFVPELGREITATEFCEGRSFNGENPLIASRIPWAANEICAEYFTPYVHTVGFSFNWFECDYTQTVWRVESVIDFDLPFYNGDKNNALFGRAPNGPILLPGISKRNMWKGMLAFDRPTWIKWLNKKTTFFLSGQFFWHYIINHERRRCSIGDQPRTLSNGDPNPDFIGYTSSPTENCGSDTEFLLEGEQTGLVGGLDLPKLDAPTGKGRDTIHQWEMLMTFAAIGFYKGGTLVPAFIYLMDPVNSYSQEVAIGVDWFYTPDIAFNITTRLIWAGAPWDPYHGHQKDSDPDNGELFEPWFLGGGNRGRSETSFQATWQF